MDKGSTQDSTGSLSRRNHTGLREEFSAQGSVPVLVRWAPISSADAQLMRLKVGRGQVGAQGGGSGGSRAEEN